MDNYTQIPNIIIDEWMNKMHTSSFTVLMAICRKTLGWQKESDNISQTQIMKITGLSKNSVIRALKELKEKELINVIEKQGITTNYTLNVTSAKSEPVPEVNGSSAKSEPPPVPKVNTQKKDKETNTKDNLHQWLIDMFYVSYSLKYNDKLIINGKEGSQIKKIIEIGRKSNPDNPQEIILKKFNLLKESDFFKLTPGILLSQWNNLQPNKPKEQPNEYRVGAVKKRNEI